MQDFNKRVSPGMMFCDRPVQQLKSIVAARMMSGG